MKRIDRHILTSFVGPFFLILLIVIFILMMQFLWVYIDELVGKGLSIGVVAEFLFWGSCTILPMALPLATLLASMMTIGQMGENNELIALKASGVSVFRVMLPILIASFIISIGTFYIINKVVPVAYNQIFTLRDDIGKTKDEIKIPRGTFYDGVEGFVLRIEDMDDRDETMHGVMLYDHSGKGNTRLTLADSAVMKLSKDKSYLTFRMMGGINYQETNEKDRRDTTLELQRIEFARQEMIIPLKNYAFHKSDSAKYGDQVKALPLQELNYGRDSLKSVRDSVRAAQMVGIAANSIFKMHQQLDTTASGRTVVFEDPRFLEFDTRADRIRALLKAHSNAQRLQQDLVDLEMNSFDYTVLLRWTDVEYLHRYAQALAVLVMFLIGAPLGALIRKGGIGVSAIVSILFFVLYWIIDITGVKLGRDGAASAPVAAFSSTVILFIIGLYLTWRAINDAELANMDNIKNGWRRIRSRISGFFRKTRIVYMGTPEFAVGPLKALLEHRYKVVGVVTVADKPAGRGQKTLESAVKRFAVEKGIPVLQPVKLKDPEFLASLAALKADLFVVVAFRMLPEEVWKMPKLGTFNLHASLLPQYRGAAPINWAVINGELRTGVTTFLIDKQIDTGGIILRQSIRIEDDETAGDVHDRLMEIGSELVLQTTQGLIERNVETRVQRSFVQGSEVLHKAPKLTRELCHIDWNDSSKSIRNLIRGLSPYPGAFTLLAREGEAPVQLKIYRADKMDEAALRTLAGGGHPAPGTIFSDGKSYLAVATADGALSLQDVQLAGKKRMDVKAFLAGFRDPASYAATAGTSKAEIEKAQLS